MSDTALSSPLTHYSSEDEQEDKQIDEEENQTQNETEDEDEKENGKENEDELSDSEDPFENPNAVNIAKWLFDEEDIRVRIDIREKKLYRFDEEGWGGRGNIYLLFNYLELQLIAEDLFKREEEEDRHEELVYICRNNNSCARQVISHLLAVAPRLPAPEPYLLNFMSGICDLRTSTYRERTQDDNITVDDRVIDCDYKEVEDADVEPVLSILKKIHINEETREYVMKTTAAHLYSGTTSRTIHFHLGQRANGKGIFHSIIELALNNYVERVDQKTLARFPNPQQRNASTLR